VLVVIGIMVVIAGIAIPMINKARKQGIRVRVAGDLNTIGVALEAYKNDFGDYPRFTPDNDDPAVTAPGGKKFINGAEMLCLALIGPRSQNGNDQFPAGHNSDTHDGDGADGPGFRTSLPPAGSSAADEARAKRRMPRTYGPYIDPSKFKVADPSPTAPADLKSHDPKNLVILSYYNTPIVYFPARGQKSQTSVAGGFVADIPGSPVPPAHPVRGSKWDARYGVRFFRHLGEANDAESLKRLRVMLGDTNFDGDLDPLETDANQANFALWATGADDKFGPAGLPGAATDLEPIRKAVEKCDDVTNFR
jgi:type II secretory pathway pseudopilin PulG